MEDNTVFSRIFFLIEVILKELSVETDKTKELECPADHCYGSNIWQTGVL
jgi:hypothetical protein